MVSGRVRMAGMTEREVEGRSGRAGAPYTKSEARHFCTMTGWQRPRPESKGSDAMRCDGTDDGRNQLAAAVDYSAGWRRVRLYSERP